MLNYVADVSEARRDYVNDDIFSRKFEMPLSEHIINILKNFNIIPGLEVVEAEVIPYGMITTFNKMNSKNKTIKNNVRLENIVNINETKSDLIKITFKKDIDGQVEYETKEIYCPAEDKHHHYFINGSKVLMLNQIVDCSTYNTESGELCFRTPIFSFPITLRPVPLVLETTSGDVLKGRIMKIRVFSVESNVIYYYFAKFGVEKTIDLFKLRNIVSIVPKIMNDDKYFYIKVCDTVYIEILKERYKDDPFIMNFVMTVYDGLKPQKSKGTKKKDLNKTHVTYFAEIYKPEFWLSVFAESFAVKKSIRIGKSGLLSFERLIDRSSAKKLSSIPFQHRKSTYHIIAYLMTNFDELMLKDNFDLANKRIRNNEVIASVFDNAVRVNMNAMMNSGDFSKERIDRLLNSLTPMCVQRAMNTKESGALLRFERFNDNSVIELSRYSMKGLGSIAGGKYTTAMPYRDRYPSYLGRIDLSICSSTDPGLTGYLCGNFKTHGYGRFSKRKDPNTYEDKMNKLEEKTNVYNEEERRQAILRGRFTDKNGVVEIHFKKDIEEITRKTTLLNTVVPRYRAIKNDDGTVTIERRARTNFDGEYILSFDKKFLRARQNPKLYTIDNKLRVELLLTQKGKNLIERLQEKRKEQRETKKKK